MPGFVGTALKWWHSHDIERWCKRTTQEVIDEITDNPVLAAAFAAQWFDHGGRPSKASFAMHALITGGYLESGAWYPKGGGAPLPTTSCRRSRRPGAKRERTPRSRRF
jgi:all-trans-retinol 13,14-reductase